MTINRKDKIKELMNASSGEILLYNNGIFLKRIYLSEDIPEEYQIFIRHKRKKNLIINHLNLASGSSEAEAIDEDSDTEIVTLINLGNGIKDEK